MGDLEALAQLPDSVTEGILNAQADVIQPEQQRAAQEMLIGPYATGTTGRTIKRTKVKKTSTGKSLSIYHQGKREGGKTAAEVAFLNEYGKKGQPARPFIRTANERAGERAAQAGEKVYQDFLDRHGL